MKILVIHNLHRKGSASGDDQVFKSETALLEKKGNEVIRYTVSNDDFDSAGTIKKILSVFGMLWSSDNYKNIKRLCKNEKPDIVHVHTFFPLLSPSVLYAAKRSGCRVVATLHDTRFVCPSAISLRGSEVCNLCTNGHYWNMCRYRCFKNSRLQSMAVAFIFKIHRKKRSFYNQIDRYICLNDNQMRLLEQAGFDKKKMVKKYNFVPDTTIKEKNLPENIPDKYAVYYGRLGQEKGISVLMNIWNEIDDIPLVVMGDGPLRAEFERWSQDKHNVIFLGYTEHELCLNIVKKAQFIVFPSVCYEGCSMVQIETESLGVPIVASRLGFSEESIIDGFNGYKAKVGDAADFRDRIVTMWNDEKQCRKMGLNARADFENKYQENDNYNQLMDIYRNI